MPLRRGGRTDTEIDTATDRTFVTSVFAAYPQVFVPRDYSSRPFSEPARPDARRRAPDRRVAPRSASESRTLNENTLSDADVFRQHAAGGGCVGGSLDDRAAVAEQRNRQLVHLE